MSFWTNLKDKVADMSASLQTNISKYKNSEFANGSMAMCALIAGADGAVSEPERSKIAALITQNEVLKIFPPTELKEKFDKFCATMTSDHDYGKSEAIQAIAHLKGKEFQGRAVLQIGIIIGGADGNFEENEKKALKTACVAVGINPAEFDL